MSQPLRHQVLGAFKSLHRTRQCVFAGDNRALREARHKINQEYKKCKHITDMGAISELIKHSRAVDEELKLTVIQAEEIAPGHYEAKIREGVVKLDNVPFKDCS